MGDNIFKVGWIRDRLDLDSAVHRHRRGAAHPGSHDYIGAVTLAADRKRAKLAASAGLPEFTLAGRWARSARVGGDRFGSTAVHPISCGDRPQWVVSRRSP